MIFSDNKITFLLIKDQFSAIDILLSISASKSINDAETL